MSYYQGGYQQQLPPNQQPPYQDQYGQYPPPGQNGGAGAGAYPGQYTQPQYPGQPTYEQQQGGGPVQQPQGGYQEPYQSPRSTSFGGGGYGGQQQQQYQPQTYQPQTYNPQNYAPQSPQQPMQHYNPQAYASPNQSPYPQQYNPAAYPEQPPVSTSGPLGGNPYGYSPGTQPNATVSPQQPAYQPSPPTTHQQYSPHHHVSPPPPSHQYGYQVPPPLPQRAQTQYGYQPPATSSPQPQNVPYPTSNYRAHSHSVGAMQAPGHQQYQISPALPGLSDETWLPSPPQYQMGGDSRQSPSPLYPPTSNNSLPSPPGSTPGPTPPAHGFVSRSNTLDRHPQARPLPGPPDPDSESDYFPRNGSHTQLTHEEEEALTQEELFSQVENAVLNAGSGQAALGHRPSISVSRAPYDAASQPTPLFAPSSPHDSRLQRNGSVVNGHLSPALPAEPQYSDESDVEAAQGLAMLQQAEADDARRQSGGSQMRFSGLGSQRNSRGPQQQGNASDSDDFGAVDMSSFGGGFPVHMSYGGDPSQLAVGGEGNGGDSYSQPVSSLHSSMRRSHASQSSQVSGRGEYDYRMDSIHPFPPFNPAARVDASGTGGLAEPSALGRRQSYDEGDEYTLMEGQLPERFPDEPPDIFFQQASATYAPGRPLPAPPQDELSLQTAGLKAQMPPGQSPYYPHAPDAYTTNAQGQWVPRSTSLISHQTTPQVIQPLRSKTDAEERRLRAQGGYSRGSVYTPSSDATPASSIVPDLPSLGAKRFVPSKLGAADFKKCEEPWALGTILKWLLLIVSPEQYTELKEAEVKEALVALFTNKVPTMNIADAEGLSNHVVANMFEAGTLVTTEEWVKLAPGRMSGVIYQLTGRGCYSATLHDHLMPGRCYARHCQRTLKKVNLQTQPARTSDSWTDFYGLEKKDWEGREKKELERQNVMHEIVSSEDRYMEQLSVLRTLYRDTLTRAEPSIISPKRREKFLRDAFGRVDAVQQANEEHLLPQLKYRQQEQGPWVVGFSDIFRQWIRKAKTAYLDYAAGFPGANFLVRQELDRNVLFREFIERASKDPRSLRLGWDTYLKAPITRLQRYTLLLGTVIKNMAGESEERRNLQVAFDEVKAVTLECDARVAEMQRKVDLSDLQHKLVLRPGMQDAVELNLDHFGRELIHRGDLQRMGGNRFTWLESHALLFDHYMVLAKTVAQRSEQGGRVEKYDVSRLPIPMDLLILENASDAAVQKSAYLKGITSVTTVTGRGASPMVEHANALARAQTREERGGGVNALQHVGTGASANSLQPVTSLGGGEGGGGKDSDKIMYPFKIKHLGREVYTLFAPTEQARREWCTKIVEAKTKHAAALYAQQAEPFRLRVMADSAFVFDAFGTGGAGGGGGGKGLVIAGSPVERALQEVEVRFKGTGRPGPICRARVNCATSFAAPGTMVGSGGGRQMVAVGTDFGVYVSEMENPRGWTRSIQMSRVTQVAVLEEFNLFLLISDKALIAYHLDVVCPSDVRNGPTPANDSTRKAPQKLSGSKDVGFFVAGRMKDRQLVFYKKRENLASVFKVLEPIYQKSTEKKRTGGGGGLGLGLFKRGTTEFFRDYDEFYIPAECTGVNLFHSSLAVSTARGFEVMTLDKKQPHTVPDLLQPHVQNIASHIKDQRALGMLRLSEQEFLLCYSNCAVYVNKHGEVSRSVIMDFVGCALSAALYGPFLVLFDSDFVEIRNAQNGRLKQIIAGREIKCLDDGGSWSAAAGGGGGGGGGAAGAGGQQNGSVNGPGVPGSRTVKFVMQHPEMEKTQIVVELLLNENMKE
ncbi:hypothetical protein LTR85_002464 [Meristemomyces frigidus]|nr:hypothetical protein LTR85_002464 [Meristemomyces frigidus]